MVAGYDHFASVVALAKQLLTDCAENKGDITLPKETVKILCDALVTQWSGRQSQTIAQFKKAT